MNRYDIRRAAERGRIRNDWLDAFCSFNFGSYRAPGREGFGALCALNEDFILPASGFGPHPHRDLEILLMPLQSSVRHEDSLGNVLDVRPDELLVMHAGRGITHSQMNASATLQDHHLQLWFQPRRRGAEPGIALRAYPAAGRAGAWQLWASG
ncbi:pirin family protein, partial [Paucibacter sp. XJ19-41]|uniref:pirin family protein n=1 Tax=Paucibacter sp. XJ19-41 TaxID=2927824 RepID=UPI002349D8AD